MRYVILAAWLLQAGASPRETPHLLVKTSASAASVAAGGRVTLRIDVTPKPGMHVYAPGQAGYSPIQVALTADSAFTAGPAIYPAGKKVALPALNETPLVYARPFRITEDVTLAPSASGTVTVKGTVRYQACDDTICYRPASVPVEWTLTVK